MDGILLEETPILSVSERDSEGFDVFSFTKGPNPTTDGVGTWDFAKHKLSGQWMKL